MSSAFYLTRTRSLLIALSMLVLFFGGGMLLLSQQSSKTSSIESSQDTPPKLNKDSKFVLENFHRSETKGDKKLWEVRAKRGEYFPASETAEVKEAILHFFRNDGTIVELQAPEAVLHLIGNALNRAETRGGITLLYGDQMRMETEQADYHKDSGTVISEGPVVFTGEAFRLEGKGLKVNVENQVLNLSQQVKSVFFGKGKQA